MKNTNFWKSSLMVLLFCFGLTSLWGQAELPLSRTAWGSTPTGWTDNGTHRSTGFACTGNSGGSLQATGKYYVVQFDSTPNELTYSLKTGGISGTSKLEVQESVDGIIWNNISVYQNVTYSTCQVETKQLSPSTRFVRFYYTKGSGNMDIDDVSITKGVQSYSITYDGNSADGGTAPTDNNEYEENDEVTVLGQGTLEKIGYHFIGWNTLANGSGTSYAESATFSMPANDVTLYAQWAINTYIVTYDGNGNDGGTAPVDTDSPYDHGSTVTVLGQGSLTLTNHSFLGWNTQADGLGTFYAEDAEISNITADITLYAQWLDESLDPQTITFDPLSAVTYGDADFNLTATASSGLTVSYASSNENVATIDGNTVTIVGVGTTDITASQLGNEEYQPATPVVQTLTVNPKNLTIADVIVLDKPYDGTTAAEIDISVAWLVGTVAEDDISFAIEMVTGEFASADAGTGIEVTLHYEFVVFGSAAANYTLTQPTLTGNILKADQTISGFENLSKSNTDDPFDLPELTNAEQTVSYESSNTAVATISGNTVTIVGAGTTTITATADGNQNYNAIVTEDNVNITLTITAPYDGVGVFEKITSLEDLTDGYYVLVGNGTKAMNTTVQSSKFQATTISVTDNKITNPETSIVWKIETVSGNVKTIFNEQASGFVSGGGSNTNLSLNSIADSNNQRWGASVISNLFRFLNQNQTTRALWYNGTVFGQYSTSNSSGYYDLELYKLQTPSTDPILTVSAPELTGFTYGEGSGPSASQSFELSGLNLDGSENVSLLADTGFELSLDDTVFEDDLTLTNYNGAETPIYVRLKAGLAIDTYVGIILIDGYETSAEVNVSGAVIAVPVVTGDVFEGTVGIAFSEQIIATETPTVYAITSGALPDGLSLDTETGIISGTPTTAGDFFEIEVTATNAAGTSEPASFLFDIAKGTQTATLPNLNAYEGDADITLPELTDQGFAIEYISDNEDVATVDGNTLTIVGLGTAEIFAGNDETVNYEAFTGGFTITVTEAPITPEAGMLFITEIADASNFNNDYIEIYNNTGNAIDMTGAKLVMIETGSSTVWNIGGTGAGNNIGTATIPARGFLIISRGNDLTTFESAFGTLNENTVFIQGTTAMYFGNGRNWELYFGGTVAVADGILIDGTTVAASGGGIRTYQNIFTGDFINIPLTSADANPGALDYLVYTAGDWTNSIAADATTSTEDVYVFGDLEISAAIQAADFGLAANGSVNIASGGSLTLAGTLTNNAAAADFVVSNNANLIQTSDVANEGAISVIRNSEPMKRLDYAMWSSPVAGQNLFGFSPLTVNGVTNYGGSEGRIYVYNGTEGYEHPNPYTAESVMNVGVGYLFRAPNNFHASDMVSYEGVFTGVPNNGTINVPLTINPGTEDPYTSMGNPYPSNVDFAEFMAENAHVSSINFWRNGSGEYIACSSGGCTDFSNLGYISVGQGFIVVHNLAMAADDVVFTNAMRVDDAADFYNKTDEADKHRFWLNLSNDANDSLNQILTGYMDNATNGIDQQIDAKLFGYEGSALYSIIEEGAYAIQGRALPFEVSDVVPLGFKAAEGGKFKVSLANFDGLFAEGAVTIYLKDNQLDIIHNLMESDYEFESVQGTFKERFEVVYETEETMGTGDMDANLVQIYQNNQEIVVSSKAEKILSVELFDLQGRKIHSNAKVNANLYQIQSAPFGTQVLVVKVQTANGVTTTKKVINK